MAHTQHWPTETSKQVEWRNCHAGVLLAECGRRNRPLLLPMWDAEREADILGKESTKIWVDNTVKESNVAAHDGIRSRILSMRRCIYLTVIDNPHLYIGTIRSSAVILHRTNSYRQTKKFM